MFESIMAFVGPIIAALVQQYGFVGLIIGYLLAAIPVVSLVIEVAEAVVLLSVSDKDDKAVAAAKAKWASVLKVVEFLPHVNVPIAPVIAKVVAYVAKAGKALMAALKAWKEG